MTWELHRHTQNFFFFLRSPQSVVLLRDNFLNFLFSIFLIIPATIPQCYSLICNIADYLLPPHHSDEFIFFFFLQSSPLSTGHILFVALLLVTAVLIFNTVINNKSIIFSHMRYSRNILELLDLVLSIWEFPWSSHHVRWKDCFSHICLSSPTSSGLLTPAIHTITLQCLGL